jgi:hypothetical protein
VAVALGITDSLYQTTVQNSMTLSYDAGSGSDMIVLVHHCVHRGTNYDSTGATYDGGAMTQIGANHEGPNTQTNDMAFYFIKDVDVVHDFVDITVSQGGAGGARHIIIAQSLTGVDQTTPHDGLQTWDEAIGVSGMTASQDITSSANDLAMDFLWNYGATPTVDGQTLLVTVVDTIFTYRASTSYRIGEATSTFDWNWSGNRHYSWNGINWNEASGGGPVTPKTLLLLGAG